MTVTDQQTPEWWNLDIFLAQTIAEKLRNFISNSCGHPGEYTQESWEQKLESIVTRLERYSQKFELDLGFDEEFEIVKAGQEALHELADIFPALWD